jgi:iron complex outermembrane receptor protein
MYLDAANRYQQPGYGLIHLDAAYTLGDVELSAYVRNAANKRYDAVGFLNGSTVIYSPPREIGLRLNWRL